MKADSRKCDKERILDALDFWYTMDFLEQDSIPKCEKRFPKNDKDPNYAHFKVDINDKNLAEGLSVICSSMLDENGLQNLKQPEEGSNYLFIGCIPREPLVQFISERVAEVGKKEKNTNKDSYREREIDSIAAILLSFNESGEIDPESLQLSPVIWVVDSLRETDAIDVSLFGPEKYEAAREALSKELESKLGNSNSDLGAIQRWAKEKIGEMLKGIKWEENQSPLLENLRVDFCVYKNPEGKKYEQSLNHGFYIDDIRRIQKVITDTDQSLLECNLKPLLSYLLTGVGDSENEQYRVDLLSDTPETRALLRNALCAGATPLGRWPSKFSLSFMQQAAVNLAVDPNYSQDIMSVNGPPGTGKTTLLKDIVVAMVVERAYKLAQYEVPDEAFERVDEFREACGDDHCLYAPNIFKFKDDTLNDLGILVCSSNNAAAENISGELPDKNSLLKGITVSAKEEPSNDEAALQYEEKEKFQTLDFFSFEALKHHAHHIFPNAYNPKEEWSAWEELPDSIKTSQVLISARLGNQANINDFNQKVLKSVCASRYSNDEIEKHKKEFGKKREAFVERYELVKKERDYLANNQREYYRVIGEIEELEAKKLCYKERLHNLVDEKSRREPLLGKILAEAIQTLNSANNDLGLPISQVILPQELSLDTLESIESQLTTNWREIERKRNILKDDIRNRELKLIRANAELEEANNAFILVRKSRVKEARAALDQAEIECNGEEASSLKNEIEVISEYLKKWDISKSEIDEIKELKRRGNDLESKIEQVDEQVRLLENRSKQIQVANEVEIPVISEDNFERFFSPDSRARKRANLSNPSSTKALNYKRDLLFYDALMVIQEFVLGSKRMKSNLKNLHVMWGGKDIKEENGDYVQIRFSDKAREILAPVAFQTLFTLTPVISSTFASVGRMLADVQIDANKRAPFGVLVIDEAGQAIPQAALGAIARCRRAIVVGDPNQVAPIVTSELKLLRESWKDKVGNTVVSTVQSVQHYADRLNKYGSGRMSPRGDIWMGCPLVVHRRCISPIFDVSNRISYNDLMLNETLEENPTFKTSNGEQIERYCLPISRWINVCGQESAGTKNHYVNEQGEVAARIVKDAFLRHLKIQPEEADSIPSLFVISPFKTVIRDFKRKVKKELISTGVKQSAIDSFCENNVGTVHTFQGKEAKEVVFLLGCSKESKGAIRWVTRNIVNVAVSRAKQRLYVIGNIAAWQENDYIKQMKGILDAYWYEKYLELNKLKESIAELEGRISSGKADETVANELEKQIKAKTQLESIVLASVPTKDYLGSLGLNEGFDVDGDQGESTRNYIHNVSPLLERISFSDELCRDFGFSSERELNTFLDELNRNTKSVDSWSGKDLQFFVKDGMLHYVQLKLMSKANEEEPNDLSKQMQIDLAARDCLSRFAFAVELLLKLQYVQAIQNLDSSFLRDVKHPTIGSIAKEISKKRVFLGAITGQEWGEEDWQRLTKNFEAFAKYRNEALHIDLEGGRLGKEDCEVAIRRLFKVDSESVGGAFCFSELVKKLHDSAANKTLIDSAMESQQTRDDANKLASQQSHASERRPCILKEASNLEEKRKSIELRIEDLKLKSGKDEEIKTLKWQVNNLERGISGENETVYELEHSGLPILILRDLNLEFKNDKAQIDVLVITPSANVVIECKNYSASIEIDDRACFRRIYEKKKPEPFYSPIVQNMHHILVLESLVRFSDISFAEKESHSLVVFANRKADIHIHDDSQIVGQVIRVDEVMDSIQDIDSKCKPFSLISDDAYADMEARAAFWLSKHDGELDNDSKNWLEEYLMKRGASQLESANAATIETINDVITETGNTQLSDDTRNIQIIEQDDEWPSISIFLREWKVSADDRLPDDIGTLYAPQINEMLLNAGFIAKCEEGFVDGCRCSWLPTEKGKEELGIVCYKGQGSEGASFINLGYPKTKWDTLKDTLLHLLNWS